MSPPIAGTADYQKPIMDVFLNPGDWYFGGPETCIRTTLGSCVAFTLWHPGRRLGGMCHYMLPQQPATATSGALDGRYADQALKLLEQAAVEAKTTLKDYQIKIFGGADMFQLPTTNIRSVSSHNLAAAHQLIQHYHLTLTASDTGGTSYRQVVFRIASGDVWIRRGISASNGPSTGSRGLQ